MPDKSTGRGASSPDRSALDKVREELTHYLAAKAGKLVSAAGDKVSGLTEKAIEEAPGGGMPKAAAKVAEGESPVKAVGGEVVEDMKDKAKEALGGGGGGGKAGDKKVTNIVEVLDVGLPLRRVYDHWTEFEEFNSFMKGVVEASRSEDDDVTSNWTLQVGPSKRSWEATVLEQVPDERITWTSKGDRATTHGSISFHELTPNLTRIVVVVEYTPGGFFEKTGNLWRAQGRRLRLDLKHFQRYVTLGVEEEPEGWRGEIREGELVRSHEEVLAEDEESDETPEDGESGAYEDDESEEEEEEDEEEEDEEEEDDERERGR